MFDEGEAERVDWQISSEAILDKKLLESELLEKLLSLFLKVTSNIIETTKPVGFGRVLADSPEEMER